MSTPFLHMFENGVVLMKEVDRLTLEHHQQVLAEKLRSAGLKVGPPQDPFDYERLIGRHVTQWMREITARQEIALIRLLAANPWWLHIIAASPNWRRLARPTQPPTEATR